MVLVINYASMKPQRQRDFILNASHVAVPSSHVQIILLKKNSCVVKYFIGRCKQIAADQVGALNEQKREIENHAPRTNVFKNKRKKFKCLKSSARISFL